MENRISAARTLKRSQAGFTLLEIVVVLVIVAIVIGGAFGLMVASNDERALNRDSTEIEVMAKRARAISSLQQKPYVLEFNEQTVTLMPLAEALIDPRDREEAAAAQEAREAKAAAGGESASKGFAAMHASYTVDPDIRIFIRRWASDTWLPVNAKNRHLWRFDPQGFCEPVGVRLEFGRSWIENEFHPLTGGIRDTAKEIY
ncbi:prepilin-type N-terminal cleavage/methylation domain-containing protein [Luteolibacter soli]|uniref:Prepilin-type N-terminal cleavage/methylation domain-containing protein n=1 Tax=Luteolibacter soli TaxID=3135280 RepID=A0ABU9AQA7_9BACT